MTKNLTHHELFWLSRYSHNQLAPLFVELKVIEPSIHVTISMVFVDEASVYPLLGGIQVSVHWVREGMFLALSTLRTKSDIDALALEVKADIEKLKTEANDRAEILAHAF